MSARRPERAGRTSAGTGRYAGHGRVSIQAAGSSGPKFGGPQGGCAKPERLDGAWKRLGFMVTIRVVGSPTVIVAELGTTLLQTLLGAGVPVSTSCGMRASCGQCRVTVLRGGECLSPLLPEELTHLGSVAKIVGTRLACKATLLADGELEVEIPEAVDVAARKRDKARRHALARASSPRTRAPTVRTATGPQRRSEPGEPHAEQIEWRPRKLSST